MTATTVYDKSLLISLIHKHALQIGEFTLASGKTANFYLDCRKLSLTGEGANVVAAGFISLMQQNWPDAVGGMAIGADPITAAVVTCAWQQGQDLRGFIVRKQAKEHGTGKKVEGPVKSGDRVIMLEDVVTTGGSSLLAIEYAREFGLQVDEIYAVVDRQQGAEQRFADVGVKLTTLIKLDELNIQA